MLKRIVELILVGTAVAVAATLAKQSPAMPHIRASG